MFFYIQGALVNCPIGPPNKISSRGYAIQHPTTDQANLSFLIPYISKREPLLYNTWQCICQLLKQINFNQYRRKTNARKKTNIK